MAHKKMEITEKELEDMIYDASKSIEGREFLRGRGLEVSGKMFRQVNLGEYGIADLISVEYVGRNKYKPEGEEHGLMYRQILVTVYELKKGSIGANAFMQAQRYVRGVLDLIKTKTNPDAPRKRIQVYVNVVLIGDDYDDGDFIYLATASIYIKCYTYRMHFAGLLFLEIDEDFLPKKKPNPQLKDNIDFTHREFISTRDSQEYTNFLEKL